MERIAIEKKDYLAKKIVTWIFFFDEIYFLGMRKDRVKKKKGKITGLYNTVAYIYISHNILITCT